MGGRCRWIRNHPGRDIQSANGRATRWSRNTAGFNDKSWLDVFGHSHSEALQIQERFRRRDFGHMELQITIEDPKTFTKPFTIKVNQLLIPDSDILETVCARMNATGTTSRTNSP